ncbi:histidine kinase dimerization/phosphoacceptor domain -containing protein [Mucilaginibacter conchicola]|nr:histidine kinase dimerization/phosphoacceptor domain -containing protein [Mucilaginibacter conchicola]
MTRVAYAQNTEGKLTIKTPNDEPADLKARMAVTKADTDKVRLLIKLASISWAKDPNSNPNELDSCIQFAYRAFTLSKRLNYNYGYTEAGLVLCRAYLERDDTKAATELLNQATGEQRARLLLVFGNHYSDRLNPADSNKVRLVKRYLTSALNVAQTARSERWISESLLALGRFEYVRGNVENGKKYFSGMIKYSAEKHNPAGEAAGWWEMAILPDERKYYLQGQEYYQHAIDIYLSLGDKAKAADVMSDMAFNAFWYKDLNIAETLFLKQISLIKAAGKNKFYIAYLQLADLYRLSGDLNKALSTTLMALKNIEKLNHKRYLENVYVSLGEIYQELDEVNESCRYYLLSLQQPKIRGYNDDYYKVLRFLAKGYIKLGKPKQALTFSLQYLKRNPPNRFNTKQIAADVLGLCYQALNKPKVAEQYFQQSIKFDDEFWANQSTMTSVVVNIAGPQAYADIAEFYASQRKFDRSKFYVTKGLSFNKLTPVLEMNLQHLNFRADSALGNYKAAIGSYARANHLRDSINRDKQLTHLNFLKVQFETAQKEKNIALLEKEAAVRKKQLQQSALVRIVTIAGLAALIVIVAILYRLNKFKTKKNNQLQQQQNVINTKNASLEQLITEKELLLKEVHHRVKNNLQTVTSLLANQLNATRNKQVVMALQESLHRVEAMAMIHQKLYSTSQYTMVTMTSYINELVAYLVDSYNPGPRIKIVRQLDEISLELALAVPIGLIINEALSNSLKYAFPNNKQGTITLRFENSDEQNILLNIADDGIGFCQTDTDDKTGNFGLRLIAGLAKEIRGQFCLNTNAGTCINIVFPQR